MSDRHVAAETTREQRLGLLAMAAVGLPFVVALVVLVIHSGDYHAFSDHALIEMNVRDVGRYQLLEGLYSRDEWSHPGPMFAYLSAPLYWLTGQSQVATNAIAVLVNAVSILGMAVIARRRGGVPLLLCSLLFSSLLMRTLSAEFLRDPWNCYVTVLPYGLLIFLVWAMASGEVKALLPATVVASYLAQVHIGFVVLALPLYGAGVAWLLLTQLRRRREEDPEAVRARRRGLVRPVLLTGIVGGILWLPVAIDVLFNDPSNLSIAAEWFSEGEGDTHPFADAWYVIMGQFAIPPEWATRALGQDYFTGQPTHIFTHPVPYLLVLVVAAAVILWRRRPHDGRLLLGVLALTFVLGMLAVVRTVGPAFYYRLFWVWIPPMIAATAVAWAAWLVVAKRWPGATKALTYGAVGAIVVLAAVNVATAATAGVPLEGDSDVIAAITPPVLAEVEPGAGQILVSDSFHNGAWYARGLVLELERRGFDARVPAEREALFNEHRVWDPSAPTQLRLVVAFDTAIMRMDRDPNLRMLTLWSSLTRDELVEWTEMSEAAEAGEIDISEFYYYQQSNRFELRDPATYSAVAVFVDESPPPG